MTRPKDKDTVSPPEDTGPDTGDIAVIGMSCRVPGAADYRTFWKNLRAGVNSIHEIPPERWDTKKYYSPDHQEPDKSVSKWAGLIDHTGSFDNRFFNISPREARNMDPQQRLLLEEAFRAIEDAAVPVARLAEEITAVYVGVMGADYHQEISQKDVVTDSYAAVGNYDCILANRLSYVFGLTGESLSIDAACASSLVAVHQAREALRLGRCSFALAAGVNLNLHPWKYISFSKSHMLSPDGQCHTFDKDANGYVPGDGIAVVLLQPLADALADGHHIYGVIRGSAVNHGGRTQSITAPAVAAQSQVIRAALDSARVNPDTITYVEAHGTGTSLGDPIEVESLNRVYRSFTGRSHFCHIGSVKTNIGHLEASAGLTGMIKILLMMKHRYIPKTLNLKTVNPIINFSDSPFVPAQQGLAWKSAGGDLPLRAGVSSFGFGGVNSHVILEEAPPQVRTEETAEPLPFLLSAKTDTALRARLRQFQRFIRTADFRAVSLHDLCHTLLKGREHYGWRFGAMVSSHDELEEILLQPELLKGKGMHHSLAERPLHFRIALWRPAPETVADLCRRHPGFHAELEEAAAQLQGCGHRISAEELARGEGDDPVLIFMRSAALYRTLLRAGLQAGCLWPAPEARLLTLYLAGSFDTRAALAWLTGAGDKPQPGRPQISFFDPVRGRRVRPLHAGQEWLQGLLDTMQPEPFDLQASLDKARQLQDSQFTFRKYLDDWSSLIRAAGLHEGGIRGLMDQPPAGPAGDTTRLLLSLIIESSLRRLGQRWDLQDRRQGYNPAFHEFLDLLVDGLIKPKEVVQLLCFDRGRAGKVLLREIDERQAGLNPDHPWTALRRHNQNLQEIGDPATWLNAAENGRTRPPGTALVLTAGGPAGDDEDPGWDPAADPTMVQLLLRLWRLGIHLPAAALPARWQRIPLPAYSFDRRSFWFTRRETENTLLGSGEGHRRGRGDRPAPSRSAPATFTSS